MGAASIMEEPSARDTSQFSSYLQTTPTTSIDNLVPLAAQSELPIAVIGDDGQLLGVVPRTTLALLIVKKLRMPRNSRPYLGIAQPPKGTAK